MLSLTRFGGFWDLYASFVISSRGCPSAQHETIVESRDSLGWKGPWRGDKAPKRATDAGRGCHTDGSDPNSLYARLASVRLDDKELGGRTGLTLVSR